MDKEKDEFKNRFEKFRRDKYGDNRDYGENSSSKYYVRNRRYVKPVGRFVKGVEKKYIRDHAVGGIRYKARDVYGAVVNGDLDFVRTYVKYRRGKLDKVDLLKKGDKLMLDVCMSVEYEKFPEKVLDEFNFGFGFDIGLLGLACMCDSYGVVKLLVEEFNFDVNVINMFGDVEFSLVDLAIYGVGAGRSCGTKLLDVLFDAGFGCDCVIGITQLIKNLDFDMLVYLGNEGVPFPDYGVKIPDFGVRGAPLLCIPSWRDNADVVGRIMLYLLAKGVNPKLEDEHGRSAVHYAALCGCEDVFNKMLRIRCKINQKDKDGLGVLDFAGLCGKEDFYDNLLDLMRSRDLLSMDD